MFQSPRLSVHAAPFLRVSPDAAQRDASESAHPSTPLRPTEAEAAMRGHPMACLDKHKWRRPRHAKGVACLNSWQRQVRHQLRASPRRNLPDKIPD